MAIITGWFLLLSYSEIIIAFSFLVSDFNVYKKHFKISVS
jgi:hypothetical protein